MGLDCCNPETRVYRERMIKPRAVTVLLTAGLLVFLTGCAGGTASDSDAPTASASPSAASHGGSSESASPTPTATNGPPALSTLTLTPAGVGSLTMNQPIPAEPAATAMTVWDPTYCVTDSRPEGDPWAGAWRAAYPTTTVPWTQQPTDAFTVYTQDRVKDAPLSGLIAWSPELTTATGIHPGSTLAELESAYPSFASVTQKELTDIYVVKDPDGVSGELWFEVANSAYGAAVSTSEPVEGTVLWIMVWPTSDFAPYSLTETDSLGGPCVP
jgi:hypothetical protein